MFATVTGQLNQSDRYVTHVTRLIDCGDDDAVVELAISDMLDQLSHGRVV